MIPKGRTCASAGNLDAGYVLQSHIDNVPESIYTYCPTTGTGTGCPFVGLYELTNGNPRRTGDYSHTAIDPNDDMTFWASTGYAGSLLQAGNPAYGSASAWATVTPPRALFINSSRAESECSQGINKWCGITVSAPAGVQAGDVLIVSHDVGDITTDPIEPSMPSGWTLLPPWNLSLSQGIIAQDGCGFATTSWLLAHVFGSQPGDSGSYAFSAFDYGIKTCKGSYNAEMDAFLVAYRGAGQDPSKYTAYGCPGTIDSSYFSIGPVQPPTNTQLLNIFSGPPNKESQE